MTITAVAPREAGVEVGTVFVRSWGYDQTNIDFYRVVGLTAKGVKLQEWSHATAEGNGPAEYVTPGDGPRLLTEWPTVEAAELNACRTCRQYADDTWGPNVPASAVRWCDTHGPREVEAPIKTKRLSTYGGDSIYVAVGPYNDHARRWDGAPEYQTAAGWGH